VPDLKLTAAGLSDRGLVRGNNEDAYLLATERRLFLVADGLGGHAGGEKASALAVDIVAAGTDRCPDWSDPPHDLPDLLAIADTAVREQAVGPLLGMGSTVVALYLRDGRFWTAHAGDSRAYRLHERRLERLTRDHTPEVESGLWLPGNGRSGMITRALGIGPSTQFELGEGTVSSGDIFLLCSDGLTDAVPDDVIAGILQGVTTPEDAVTHLVESALAAGGPDNITTVVVAIA
jgi:serine/threonine protein phosphatase PrpC